MKNIEVNGYIEDSNGNFYKVIKTDKGIELLDSDYEIVEDYVFENAEDIAEIFADVGNPIENVFIPNPLRGGYVGTATTIYGVKEVIEISYGKAVLVFGGPDITEDELIDFELAGEDNDYEVLIEFEEGDDGDSDFEIGPHVTERFDEETQVFLLAMMLDMEIA